MHHTLRFLFTRDGSTYGQYIRDGKFWQLHEFLDGQEGFFQFAGPPELCRCRGGKLHSGIARNIEGPFAIVQTEGAPGECHSAANEIRRGLQLMDGIAPHCHACDAIVIRNQHVLASRWPRLWSVCNNNDACQSYLLMSI